MNIKFKLKYFEIYFKHVKLSEGLSKKLTYWRETFCSSVLLPAKQRKLSRQVENPAQHTIKSAELQVPGIFQVHRAFAGRIYPQIFTNFSPFVWILHSPWSIRNTHLDIPQGNREDQELKAKN